MVNLVITGKAVSNAFDNTMEIDTGGAKKVLLIVTLFFFYSYCKWSFVKPKPKLSLWPITKDIDNPVNQSKLTANICGRRESAGKRTSKS